MKRLTDTEKWRDRWFRKLDPTWKLVYLYCKDMADNAGILNLDPELAEFCIGAPVDWSEFDRRFDGIMFPIQTPNGRKRYWIPSLIWEQCKGEFSTTSPPHRAIIKELRSWNLLERYDQMVSEMVFDQAPEGEQALLPHLGLQATPELDPEAQMNLLARWNKLAKAKGLPEIVRIDGTRLKNYQNRLEDFPDFWEVLEKEVPLLKPFACGENESDWVVTFDYIVKSRQNFSKIKEGFHRSVQLARKARAEEKKAEKHKRRVLKAVNDYVEVLKEMIQEGYSEADMTRSKRAFAREYGTEAIAMVEEKVKNANPQA